AHPPVDGSDTRVRAPEFGSSYFRSPVEGRRRRSLRRPAPRDMGRNTFHLPGPAAAQRTQGARGMALPGVRSGTAPGRQPPGHTDEPEHGARGSRGTGHAAGRHLVHVTAISMPSDVSYVTTGVTTGNPQRPRVPTKPSARPKSPTRTRTLACARNRWQH